MLAKTGPRRSENVGAALIEHRRPDHVRRHQVGGELDASIGHAEQPREDAHGERLGSAGNAFDERVPTGQQRDGEQKAAAAGAHDDTRQPFGKPAFGTACVVHYAAPPLRYGELRRCSRRRGARVSVMAIAFSRAIRAS